MGIVRDLYYARKMSAGLKLPAPTVALLIKRLRLAAAMGGGVTKTVSGSPAHITDALAKAALSVLASIEPIQDLHGYDNPWHAGGGVNKWDEEWEVGTITGGANSSSSVTLRSKNYIPVDPGATYCFSGPNSKAIYVYFYDSGKAYINAYITVHAPSTFTVPSGCSYIRFAYTYYIQDYTTYNNDIAINYPSTVTTYSPYSNICPITGRTGVSVYVGPTQDQQDATTYAVDWTSQAGTVYGGTLDVVTGLLTVDRASISIYAGETLPGAWISDRDVYAPGTSPTTGAQVVYELATPLTYQLTAQEVQMLLGENYVWSSSGDTVSVTYYAEGNANPLQSLNILLGGNYSNPKTADDVSDKEALDIILGGNK